LLIKKASAMSHLQIFPRTCKAEPSPQLAVVVAHLQGDNICSALGIVVESQSPVLTLCRKLIAAGCDPAKPLNVYRGKTLALRVLGIGEAAGLEVNGDGTGFRPATKSGRASPIASTALTKGLVPPSHSRAPTEGASSHARSTQKV